MNEQPKELWLQQLASNRQTTGCLYDMNDEAYCCLGALSQCYINETGKSWEEVANGPFQDMYGWEDSLPDEVMEWAGLPDNDPKLVLEDMKNTALPMTLLNDDYGYTFKQLAELIEEQL